MKKNFWLFKKKHTVIVHTAALPFFKVTKCTEIYCLFSFLSVVEGKKIKDSTFLCVLGFIQFLNSYLQLGGGTCAVPSKTCIFIESNLCIFQEVHEYGEYDWIYVYVKIYNKSVSGKESWEIVLTSSFQTIFYSVITQQIWLYSSKSRYT